MNHLNPAFGFDSRAADFPRKNARLVDTVPSQMKSPKTRVYGKPGDLTSEEIFLEIRDIFVGAISRYETVKKDAAYPHKELAISHDQSVHASR